MSALRVVAAEIEPCSMAERALLAGLELGEEIVVGDGRVPAVGDAEQTVRGSFLRRLLVGDGARVHEKGLRLAGALVEGTLDLQSCVVRRDLSLRHCRFEAAPIFDHAQIEGLWLNGSVLPGLRAEWLVTRGPMSIDSIVASGEVRLLGARIRGQLDCDGARIESPGKNALTLSRAEIGAALFLRGIALDGILSLNGATARVVVDEPASWPAPGHLNLDGFVYDGFALGAPTSAKARLAWLRLQCTAHCDAGFTPQPFEQCAQVLRRAGHADDARTILIAKERLQREAERRRTRAPLRQLKGIRDALLGGTIRYGHAPMLALVWLLVFWLVGAGVFAFVHHEHAFRPHISLLRRAEWMACAGTEGESWAPASLHKEVVHGRALQGESQLECFLRQPETRSYPRYDTLVYSLDALLPVVSLGMDDTWAPDDTKPWGKLGRGWMWLQTLVGWALTFLSVAGFSGLVKTK